MKIPILPILLMATLYLGAGSYVFYRIGNLMPPTVVGRALLVLTGVIVSIAPFMAMGMGDRLPQGVASFLYKVGTSWLILFLYLLMYFLLLDLIRLTHLLPLDRYVSGNWMSACIHTIVAAALLIVGYIHYNNKARVELPLTVEKLLPPNGSLKIVAISDLHLGYGIGRNEAERWVELINRENPDVVLIAGDITDNSVRPLYEQRMEEVFGNIRAGYGVYAVPGNHEYIAGIGQSLPFLQKAGLTVLRDSAALVAGRFYVVGRDDRSNSGRKSLEELTAGLDHSKPIILLDHQPYALEEAERNGIDLQLSGHTHKGQVWPVSLVTKALFEQPHGYLRKGNTHVYVSSGIGIWGGKFRIGTQSEYVVIELSGRP